MYTNCPVKGSSEIKKNCWYFNLQSLTVICNLLYCVCTFPRATYLCSAFLFPDRFGLPVNFLSVVMKPHRKAQKKLHDILKDQYGYLDSKFVVTEADVSEQITEFSHCENNDAFATSIPSSHFIFVKDHKQSSILCYHIIYTVLRVWTFISSACYTYFCCIGNFVLLLVAPHAWI